VTARALSRVRLRLAGLLVPLLLVQALSPARLPLLVQPA
jgi:hypothetical protein